MFKVCANLEEAMEAADSKLLWLYYGPAHGWVPAHKDGTTQPWRYYGTVGWPPKDFAILIEDE